MHIIQLFMVAPLEELTLCYLHPAMFVDFSVRRMFCVPITILDGLGIFVLVEVIQFLIFLVSKATFFHPLVYNMG